MTLDPKAIQDVMIALAATRPVFHSEADFQHGFAWQLHAAYPDARIRLETRPRPGVRFDVLGHIDGRRIAFELKYLLRDLSASVDGELFELPNHSAQDLRRYDFAKDIARLEILRTEGYADAAYAIALTNDPSYWAADVRDGVADAAFRIGEGRTLLGSLGWAAHTGTGTMRGREEIITLAGAYDLRWSDYSDISSSRNGRFRYLLIQVA